MSIFVNSIATILGNRKLLTIVFLLGIICVTEAQNKYDFSIPPTITNPLPTPDWSWNTEATITIAGIDYVLTTGGNGSFEYKTSEGNGGTACLKKPSAGGDSFTLERVDGNPFNFFGFWIKEEAINSYADIDGVTLPPLYTITFYKTDGTTETFNDNTSLGSGYSTTSIHTITKDLKVTSVSISFPANYNFWIDDIIISSDDEIPPSVAIAPTTPVVQEDTEVELADNIQISDANGRDQTVTFTVTGGTLTLGTSGITFGGDGNGSDSFTAAGTLANINTALDLAKFQPSSNLYGVNAGSISFVSNNGMSNSNRASVTFDIISVNDAPIIGGTPNKIAIEQSPYSFTPTASDVEGDELSFSIINKPSWASFDRSTGRLYGTPSESNIGLYASLIISVYDGDLKSSLPSFNLEVINLNKAPEINTPASVLITENAPESLSGISISDADAGTSPIQVSLSGTNGTITLSSTTGLVFSVGDGTTDATMTFEGSQNDINLALDDILFTPTINYSGSASLAIEANDLGNTGEGGAQTNTKTIPITIEAIPPAVTNVTSSTPNGLYGESDVIEIQIDFSKEVSVTGTPQLTLASGATNHLIDYISGSGSNSLIFNYTIQEGDTSNDLDYLSTNALTLNAGSIKGGNSLDAILTLPTPGTANSLGANKELEIDGIKPSGYSVSIDQDPIFSTNQNTISFTFSGAEIGSSYDYTFSSTGGGTNITGSGTVITATEQITGIDLSSLNDGTITLSAFLTDNANNKGNNVTDKVEKDVLPPTGYLVDWDDIMINNLEAQEASFTISNAEQNTEMYYEVSSSGDGNTATITNAQTITNGTETIKLDVSSLQDGILSVKVSLTDKSGNTGSLVSDNASTLDKTAPNGYTVAIDQHPINRANQDVVSFTFEGAEIATKYSYTFSSSEGGIAISGSGTISNLKEQITGVDLSSLADGTITLSVVLEDLAGNIGALTTATSIKNTNETPTVSNVAISGMPTIGEQLTGIYTYTDADGDVENGSTYTWYRSEDKLGNGKTVISGATTNNYTLQTVDTGKYISFEVSPNDGIIMGISKESSFMGPIKTNQTISFPSIPTKTYGDATFTLGDEKTDQGLTVTYTATDPDIVTISGNQATILKAGSTTITASQAGNNQTNSAKNVQQTLLVTKASLTITSQVTSKIYGATDPEFTVIYDGFVNGDDETTLDGALTIDRALGEAVGIYTITSSGYTSNNYTINYVNGSLEINKAMLTVIPENKSKIYGATDPEFTVVYDGFVNGDDKSALGGTFAFKRGVGENVGTYSITGSGYTSNNYTINYIKGTMTITQATLFIIADANQLKVYGEKDPQLTYSVAGFVNGDDSNILNGNLTRASGEDAGIYTITLGTLNAGANYLLQLETADFIIEKAKQEIVWNQDLSFNCDSDSQMQLMAASTKATLPMTYTISNTSIAEVIGESLIQKQSGSTKIIASQPGDKNHHPAIPVEKTIQVSQPGLIRQHWDNVLVFDNSSDSFINFQWYKNGSEITGATKQYYSENGNLNGNYYVKAITKTGKEITSCPLHISGENSTERVTIVPNPVMGASEFILECNFDEASLNGGTISIVGLNGKILQTVSIIGNKTTLTAPIQTGMYVIVLSLSNGDRRTANLLVK
ncbi:MBG domain-containing protein [Galbibacter orientalis]|uniref:MBG domain-containing protein n=1 Tax=Galbibacter orientalis TaxID=453852 RepID=UPI0030805601